LLKISDVQGKPLFCKNLLIEGGLAVIKLDREIIGTGIRIASLITDSSVESKRIFFK